MIFRAPAESRKRKHPDSSCSLAWNRFKYLLSPLHWGPVTSSWELPRPRCPPTAAPRQPQVLSARTCGDGDGLEAIETPRSSLLCTGEPTTAPEPFCLLGLETAFLRTARVAGHDHEPRSPGDTDMEQSSVSRRPAPRGTELASCPRPSRAGEGGFPVPGPGRLDPVAPTRGGREGTARRASPPNALRTDRPGEREGICSCSKASCSAQQLLRSF